MIKFDEPRWSIVVIYTFESTHNRTEDPTGKKIKVIFNKLYTPISGLWTAEAFNALTTEEALSLFNTQEGCKEKASGTDRC